MKSLPICLAGLALNVRAVLHPVGSDRGRRHGGTRTVASAQPVYGHTTGADDCIAWDADPIVPYDGGPLGDPFNPVKPVFPP
jgi:hypothetical protein